MFHVEQQTKRDKMDMNYVKGCVRDVVDFPQKGVIFRDLTTDRKSVV